MTADQADRTSARRALPGDRDARYFEDYPTGMVVECGHIETNQNRTPAMPVNAMTLMRRRKPAEELAAKGADVKRPRLISCSRSAAFLALGLALAVGGPAGASESTYPDKPVHLIVPFPAGGGADNLARLIMPKVSSALGQPIVIENRAGAGGNVGAEYVARATPDGYTLLYGTNGTHSINASLYRELHFDPVKDFAPVSRMTEIAAMLVVNPNLPVKSVTELIQYAKANPGKLNFASAGNGTTSHLSGELFKTMAGIDIVHVPYRGGALAVSDLMSGQVQMMIDVMPNVYPLAKDGRIRGIAVSTAQRFPGAPDLPTIAESGLPGFESSAWDGVLAPAGTPEPVIAKLNAAIRQALSDPELIAALRNRGARPVPDSPEDFAHHIETSTRKWAKVVKASGAKID